MRSEAILGYYYMIRSPDRDLAERAHMSPPGVAHTLWWKMDVPLHDS